MSTSSLDIAHLSLSLDKKRILDDVSFKVEAGEYVAIIGPNGAGKTTLLRCIARLLTPDQGEIRLEGRPIGAYRQRHLAQRISYVPQAEGRMLPYTAYEFVLMARYPHLGPLSGVSREDERAAQAALEATETEAFSERALDTLSGGERQKVFVAAAVAQGASVLLLDEPTTFLDYKHQVEVLALIRQLNREAGKTILSVTHDLNRGVYESDQVLALKAGKVAFFGAPAELYEPAQLEAIYETPFDLVAHPPSGRALVVPADRGEAAGDGA